MAIKSNTDTVTIEVTLEYNQQQAQRIAQQVAGFQRSQEQQQARHKAKLEANAEAHAQRLKQLEERSNKQAELRAKQHQERLLKGTKTWSEKMVTSIGSIRTTLLALAAAFVSAQLIGGIKQLATEALSLASDINTLAKATGLAVEELSKLRGVALVTGVQFTTLQASFGAIAAKLEDARRGAVEAQNAFKALSIDFNTADLQDVIEALYNAAQNTENVGKVAKIAGNEAALAFGKMGTYADNFDDAMDKAKNQFGELDTAGAEALNSLADKLAEIRLKTQYSITNALAPISVTLGANLDSIGESVSKLAASAITAFAGILDTLVEYKSVIGAIARLVPTLAIGAIFRIGAISIAGASAALLRYLANLRAVRIAEMNAAAASVVTGRVGVTPATGEMLANQEAMNAAVARGTGLVSRLGTGVRALAGSFNVWLIAIIAANAALDLLFDQTAGAAIRRGDELISQQNSFADSFKNTRKALLDLVKTQQTDDLVKSKSKDQIKDNIKSLEAVRRKYIEVAASLDLVKPTPENLKANEALLKGLRAIDTQLSALKSSSGGVSATSDKEKPEDKLKALLDAQKAATKELARWDKLLHNGTIDLEIYKKLTDSIKGDLWKQQADDLEKYIALREKSVQGKYFAKLVMGSLSRGAATPDISAAPPTAKLADARTLWQRINDEVVRHYNFVALVGSQYTNLFRSLADITGSMLNIYDSLIQAEQYRLEAQRAAHQERIDALNDELTMLNRLGFGNTLWARRKQQEAEEAAKQDSSRLKRLQKERQRYAVADATINSLASFTTNLKAYAWPLGAILGALSLAAGFAQVKAIQSQQFATGGMIQGNPYQDKTQVLAQGGEYIVNRQATARNANLLESINNGASIGGGGGITVNINGNVLGEDRWVRDRLLPEINRAVREGHALANA